MRRVLKNPLVQTAVTWYACQAGPQACAAASASFTAHNGGDLGEVVFAATLSYVSAETFAAAGDTSEARFLSAEHLKPTLAHGVVGGVVAEFGGGRFRTGFLSAGAAQLAASWIGALDAGTTGISYVRVTATAVVGGTAATHRGRGRASGGRGESKRNPVVHNYNYRNPWYEMI